MPIVITYYFPAICFDLYNKNPITIDTDLIYLACLIFLSNNVIAKDILWCHPALFKLCIHQVLSELSLATTTKWKIIGIAHCEQNNINDHRNE